VTARSGGRNRSLSGPSGIGRCDREVLAQCPAEQDKPCRGHSRPRDALHAAIALSLLEQRSSIVQLSSKSLAMGAPSEATQSGLPPACKKFINWTAKAPVAGQLHHVCCDGRYVTKAAVSSAPGDPLCRRIVGCVALGAMPRGSKRRTRRTDQRQPRECSMRTIRSNWNCVATRAFALPEECGERA
jgi:hypothetical protein